MCMKLTIVLSVALLLPCNEAGGRGKKRDEIVETTSARSNEASSSGQRELNGLDGGRTGHEADQLGVQYTPAAASNADGYWNMRRADLDATADIFAEYWMNNIRKLDGKPKETFDVGSCEITLNQLTCQSESKKIIDRKPDIWWVKVEENNFKFCARMKLRQKGRASGGCPNSNALVCLQPPEKKKLVFRVMLDLSRTQYGIGSTKVSDKMQLVGLERLDEKTRTLIEEQVRNALIERMSRQTKRVIDAIKAALKGTKRAAATSAGEEVVAVKVISSIDVL